jgi:Na+/H+-dicarboxylate symporter
MKTFLRANRFSFVLLGSMLLGGIVGGIWGKGADVLSPISDLFLNLLYCCVVPMIFISLVASISKMENLKRLGKLLIMMLIIFVATQVLASLYMVMVCGVFNPAQGAKVDLTQKVGDLTSNNNFLSMFTVNDFSLLWSRKSLMALIVFAMMTGVATVAVGEKGKAVVNLFDSLQEIIMKMIGYVMYIAPIGLGVFFATLIGDQGSQLIGPLSRSIIIYLIAAIVYYVLANTLYAFIGGGREGIRTYWANVFSLSLTALGTCSSAACIPLNLIATRKIGVPDSITDISIPLGTNLHKDGACLITILKIAFMCSVFGVNFMDPKILFTAILVSVIASTVMGAIPAGGYVGEIFIISAFNFPPAAIPIMVLIGTITDAPATAINAASQPGAAMIIARFSEGKDWLKTVVSHRLAGVEE